jgi:ABC-type Na+ efflux pump permease subunit
VVFTASSFTAFFKTNNMRTLKFFIVTLSLLLSVLVKAQDQVKEGASETGARQENTGAAVDAGAQNESDTTETSGAGNTSANDATANGQNAAEAGSSDPAISNVPAVPQKTSSDSGSPAVLSNSDGILRSGTNNLPRATMNMAGAPAGDLNLDQEMATDVDKEIDEKQQDSQRKAIARQRLNEAKKTDEEAGTPPGNQTDESAEINERSRRENNLRSTQNKAQENSGTKGRNETDSKTSKKKKSKG